MRSFNAFTFRTILQETTDKNLFKRHLSLNHLSQTISSEIINYLSLINRKLQCNDCNWFFIFKQYNFKCDKLLNCSGCARNQRSYERFEFKVQQLFSHLSNLRTFFLWTRNEKELFCDQIRIDKNFSLERSDIFFIKSTFSITIRSLPFKNVTLINGFANCDNNQSDTYIVE